MKDAAVKKKKRMHHPMASMICSFPNNTNDGCSGYKKKESMVAYSALEVERQRQMQRKVTGH